MELKKRKTQKELQVELAKYLIKFNNGQRLPSNRNLASATHMSMGSVSAALKELQDQGVVTIKNRGHLGSIVNDLSLGTLWNVVEQGPLVIALTLPMHCRFEGLATGLKMAFEKFGIETYLIYIRGSTTRLKALSQKRCHVAVMSGLAAEEHCRVEDEIIMELPQGSWVSQYCIYYRTLEPEGGRPLRIAVDKDSSDHLLLTDLVFADKKIERVFGPYIKIPRLLRSGDVDATIWTIDQADAYLGRGVYSKTLSDEIVQKIGAKSTSAAFVTITGSELIKAVFQAAIDPKEILSIQDRVCKGEMIPSY
ncbi:MAG: GntR family transcriptional regulator [Leptolinea sp.]|jgi:hypothetical protein|nr:GntR family transcriptional regulator [Leptolinea sp.]